MIVSTPREVLWAFINKRVGIPWSSDFRAIGAVRNDCLLAVVAYNGMSKRSCFMHSAIDDPSVIDRTFVRAIFEYPFVVLGMNSLFAHVDSVNTRALDIDKRVGFREVNRFPDAGAEGDLILLHMRKEDCKWIKRGTDGKQEPAAGT